MTDLYGCRSVWELIRRRAEATPDRLMFVNDPLTFGKFHDRAEAVAAGLAARGVGVGTRVAWQLPTTVDSNGNRGFTTDIGLIFFQNRIDNRTFIGHGGDQNGFISYIEFEPATRQASIMVFNTNVIYAQGTPAERNVVSRLRKVVRDLY